MSWRGRRRWPKLSGCSARAGLLLGYDLLDTAPVRLLRFGVGHDTRLLGPGQLEAELAGLRTTTIRVRPGIGRLV